MAIQARLCRDNYGYSDGASQNLMGIFNGENGFRFQKQELLPISQPRMKRACFDVKNGQEMALFRVAAAQMEEERREVDRFISYQVRKKRTNLGINWQLYSWFQTKLCSLSSVNCNLMVPKFRISDNVSSYPRTPELRKFLKNRQYKFRKFQYFHLAII